MATVIAALIGLAAIVAGALLTTNATRRIEFRKQTAQLAADAVLDLMRAFSQNSEARACLNGNSAENLLRDLGPDEKGHFIRVLAESRVTMIGAKARLTVFGSLPVAQAAVTALTEDFSGADASDQFALCELVQRIRKELYPEQERLGDTEIIAMLFGTDAEALAKTDPRALAE